MKKYKYKREHFQTQEDFDKFRKVRSRAQIKWLNRKEEKNPSLRERRILKQRLYSRYHYRTDCRKSFAQWLRETCGINDIKRIPLEELREAASKS